jgi:hypothetical protein
MQCLVEEYPPTLNSIPNDYHKIIKQYQRIVAFRLIGMNDALYKTKASLTQVRRDNTMKRLISMVTLGALSLMLALPVAGSAAEKKVSNEVVMKMGNKVHLFHSSKVEVQNDIALNEILPVYRSTGKSGQTKEVGAVKVLSYSGEHYFEAEIVKGEIKVGDTAMKGSSALLVQPSK